MLFDGWNYARMSPCKLPKEAESAFNKAIRGFAGNRLVPVLYVGSKSVEGKYYCIICRTTLETNPPVEGCQVVYVHENTRGGCKIAATKDVIQ